MYWRFQADNFFVTTITNDQTLVPWVDGVINALEVPNIEPWKLFYVIFRVDDINNRFTLPVYVENNQMKYKGYNVKSQFELKAYDTISLNDLAENFNYLFNNIDDIWTIVKKWGLDILVYGWKIVKWWINIDIADTTITLPDNSSRYIVFDYSDSTLKAVTSLDNLSHYCFAEVSTFGWEVTNIESKKSFNAWEIFSNTFFERNSSTWAIQIKEWSITKDDIDLSTLSTDDIPEWEINKYFTNPESYQTKANMKTNLDNPNNTTYPTTKAVVDAIELAWGWDMMKTTYDPNNKRADAFNMDNMTEWTNKSSVIKSTTTPSNPTQWMVWYDMTNNKLKTYNWSSWEMTWGEWNTKTFVMFNSSDLTTAQKAYEWQHSGKTALIEYSGILYVYYMYNSGGELFKAQSNEVSREDWLTESTYKTNTKILKLFVSSWQVTSISWFDNYTSANYLDTTIVYSVPYIPQYNWSPATKKYVDDTVSSAKATWDTAPSDPVEWQLWYDTTNDVLKVYDWTNWNAVGGGSTDVNTKTFFLSNTSDLTTAQAAYDWKASWKNAIINYGWINYILSGSWNWYINFTSTSKTDSIPGSDWYVVPQVATIQITESNWTVTWISAQNRSWYWYIPVSGLSWNWFTPTEGYHPATKKYVDDKTATISTTAPSNPTEWTLWYDSTNHVLKVYNWSSWAIVWEEWNTKTFKISNTSDLTNAQAALNWYLQWNTPYVLFDDIPQITTPGYSVWPFFVPSYTTTSLGETTLYFHCPWYEEETSSTSSNPKISIYYIGIRYNASTQVVTSILQGTTYTKNLGDMYKATYDPNNKNGDAFSMDNMINWSNNKYIIKSDTTPNGPTEWSIWYSTRLNNSQIKWLKTYDGSVWEKVWYRGKTFFLATLDASTGAEVLNWLYWYKVLTAHSSTPPSTWPADWTATIVYNNKAYIYNKFETASIDWWRTTSFYFINPEVYRSWNDICQDCLKYTMSNASWTGMNYSFTETQITVNVWTWGADYSDFDYESKSWSDITIEDFSTIINNPTSNFTINCWTVIPWLQYIVRINTWSTYTLTLWTWITNPYNEPTALVASKTTTLIFLATSSNSLELFTSRTA